MPTRPKSLTNVGAASLNLWLALAATVSMAMTGCTSPVEPTTNDAITAAGKSLPFAYDTTIDQITHMSCSNMPMANPLPYNASAYFTFRAGAYTNGGVTLTNEFYTTLKKYSFEKQSEILVTSPQNTDTVIQLSLRGENRQSIKVGTSSTPVAGQDYFNMFAPLGTEDVALSLVKNPAGARVRQLRTGMAGGARLEGSLYFTQNSATALDARKFASGLADQSGNTGVLAVTYTNGSAFSARSPLTTGSKSSQSVVYGRSYRPGFSQPTVAGGVYQDPQNSLLSYPQNVMTSMTEGSLDGKALSPTPGWSCPTALQLRVVRAEDAGKVAGAADCRRMADPTVLTPELKILRNTLRVEDWYIDVANHCMIPKRVSTGCYGSVTNIKYTMSDQCGNVDSNGNSNCVQYASTCYRN